MSEIRIIALDLDGTLLNSRKELTPGCRAALDRAAAAGIEIVPTTGRYFGGMPEVIRALPYLHYAITVNGAQVYDIRRDAVVYRAELPCAQAVAIMQAFDDESIDYDCYMDNQGWITRSVWERAAEFGPDEHYFHMVRTLRKPVDDLKRFVLERGGSVQKVQAFTWDMPLRRRMLDTLAERFESIAISSSVVNNIEVNHADANKGAALLRLAEYLGLDRSQTAAFGDGLNDVSMIADAGIGIAMANACQEVAACADRVTAGCDEDGVAAGIETWCL